MSSQGKYDYLYWTGLANKIFVSNMMGSSNLKLGLYAFIVAATIVGGCNTAYSTLTGISAGDVIMPAEKPNAPYEEFDPVKAHLMARKLVDPSDTRPEHSYTRKTVPRDILGPDIDLVLKKKPAPEERITKEMAAAMEDRPWYSGFFSSDDDEGEKENMQAEQSLDIASFEEPENQISVLEPQYHEQEEEHEYEEVQIRQNAKDEYGGYDSIARTTLPKFDMNILPSTEKREEYAGDGVQIASKEAEEPKPEEEKEVSEQEKEHRKESESLGRLLAAMRAKPAEGYASKAVEAKKQERNAPSSSSGLAVVNLRVGEHPNKTRMVLDFTAKPAFSYQVQEEKNLLVITLTNTKWGPKDKKVYSRHPLLLAYIAKEAPNGDTILAIKLRKRIKVLQDAVFPPSDGAGYRIVFDVAETDS